MTKLPIKKTLPDLSLKKRSFALTALLLTLFGKNAMSTEDPKRAILKSAIDSDNAMNISAAIKAGALVNGPWERNTTPLMYAAATRKVTAVSELIRSGAQVDIKDTEGDSAITMAMSQWDKTLKFSEYYSRQVRIQTPLAQILIPLFLSFLPLATLRVFAS
jgi:hypothetical protein